MAPTLIRFPQGGLAALRGQLFADPDREAFALALGRREVAGDQAVIRVTEVHHPREADYQSRGLAHLRLNRQYVYDRLAQMQQRGDADTLIDLHTHPFSPSGAAFSAHDDADEQAFHQWLTDTLDGIHYASIVLSRSDYRARLWQRTGARSQPVPARVRAQTAQEQWVCADDAVTGAEAPSALDLETGFLARGVPALGLDVLRRIVVDQRVAVIGVGGLGSAMAENLIHTGFHRLVLIDPDRVETTNLNRIVGAGAEDARAGRLKVEAVADHLRRINPDATLETHATGIEDDGLLPSLATCDWLLLATDSHASRFRAQAIALRLAIPLISAGVNITVSEGRVSDMSGEVITARYGDTLCLNCLGRLSPTQIAAETLPALGEVLARRGYVSGAAVKEPAVKTLNAMLAALAVETLVNQYTGRQPHTPILVYESNQRPCIYADEEGIANRPKGCMHCG